MLVKLETTELAFQEVQSVLGDISNVINGPLNYGLISKEAIINATELSNVVSAWPFELCINQQGSHN